MDALDAFNASYGTFRKVAQDKSMSDIMSAQESESSQVNDRAATADEMARAQAETGAIAEQDAATFAPQDGEAPLPAASDYGMGSKVVTGNKTDFLGKTYDQAPTETQKDKARLMAMSGVMAKYGDPEKAMQLRSQANQADLGELQIKAAQRADKQGIQDEERKAGQADLFKQSRYAQQAAGYQDAVTNFKAADSDYKAKIANGAAPQEVGPPPQAPDRPVYTTADSLHDTALGLEHDAKHGNFDTAKWQGLAEKMQKVQDEGYEKTLRLAQSGAPISNVVEAFNSSGKTTIKPEDVVGDRWVTTPDGVKSREITIRGPKGQPMVINSVSELDGLGKAADVFARHFQGKTDARGDKQVKISEGQLANSQGNLSLEKQKFEQGKTQIIQGEDGAFAVTIPAKFGEAPKVMPLVGVPGKGSKQNDLKASHGLTKLQEMYGTKNDLGEFTFKPEAREKFMKANVIYERNIRSGMTPMAATDAAIQEAEGKAATPKSKADWVNSARKDNKGVSDAELEAYYDKKYGGK